ncbi:MAG: DUF21 domain-containing protein, partial [Deltaproteobacteria bacterium]|nr:DUF21 domain-containing protein [Deltaproteobacteria bacterium]
LPKTLGVVHSRTLAPVIAGPIGLLVWILTPLVWFSKRLTGLVHTGKVLIFSEHPLPLFFS